MQVILDEAGQATLAEAMIVLSKGVKQLTIAGDPQQLAPLSPFAAIAAEDGVSVILSE